MISCLNKKYTYMLPDWKGYFKYDYSSNQFYFQNGDYRLNWQQLVDMGIDKRTDWYYII